MCEEINCIGVKMMVIMMVFMLFVLFILIGGLVVIFIVEVFG